MRLPKPLDTSTPPANDGDYGTIPSGWYQCVIEETAGEDFSTEKGQGQRVVITFVIEGPTHEGRKFWARHILSHTGSEKAAEIGREQLRSCGHHAGISQLSDTDQLVGRRVEVNNKVRPATERYDAREEIRAYRPIGGGVQSHGGRAGRIGNAQNQQVPRRAGPPRRLSQADVRPAGAVPQRVAEVQPVPHDDDIPF